VQYDKIADRWIFMQFSVTAPYPYTVCMAVSTTPDPTGSYYRYEFSGFGTEFPDYPKLRLAGRLLCDLQPLQHGVIFTGPRFCSYDRSKMLTGAVATQQCFTLAASSAGICPRTLTAKTLPAGRLSRLHSRVRYQCTQPLEISPFDWTTPANTTLTGPDFHTGCGVQCGLLMEEVRASRREERRSNWIRWPTA